MTGTWKQEDGSAVIDCCDKWTTQIIKVGDHYSKRAYQDGKLMGVSSEVKELN